MRINDKSKIISSLLICFVLGGWAFSGNITASETIKVSKVKTDSRVGPLILQDIRVAVRPVMRASSEHFVLEWVGSPVGMVNETEGVGFMAGPSLPTTFSLSQNYPNPFNPSTTIAFEVPVMSGSNKRVSLTIYDVRGRRIETLLDDELEPGRYAIHWDGRNERGQSVASGIYLYRLRAGDETFTRKMTVLK